MHWARAHVNPMVALRDVLCSDRWEEDWPQIATRVRGESLQAHQQRQRARWTQHRAETIVSSNTTPVSAIPVESSDPEPIQVTPMVCNVPVLEKPRQPYRPPANHPWRHSPIGSARFKSSQRLGVPKL